jgi:glycosyltransferase 2 family protein
MKYKRFIPLFAFVVFCIAAYLLYHALSAYDRATIVEAIFAIPRPRLALGAFFVAGSYFSLTLFDTLAIRYIGAKLPYRRIALASFTALSIGHTLGVAAASSGAIRYRFYSRWGIGAGDIARIILFCAMTAVLGLNALMGLALLLQANVAAKLLGFSQTGAIAVGAGCLLLTALYLTLAAVLRQPLTIKRWEIPIPPFKLALAQISVGATNFCFVAAALYELLPATVGVGYFAVATVYVLANVATIVSHVPGGLGVLEAVIIHVLPEAFVIGALVVFRFIYFLIPFTIGVVLFVACELAKRRGRGAFQS